MDAALDTLAGVDMAKAGTREIRWAFAEWKQLVKRRFGNRGALLYSQGVGRTTAQMPHGDGGALEVAVMLGTRWQPCKVVSDGSLRRLKPLSNGGA